MAKARLVLNLEDVQTAIAQLGYQDRIKLNKLLSMIRKREHAQQPIDKLQVQLQSQLASAQVLVQKRQQLAASVSLMAELPISEKAQAIVDELLTHQVIIVAGETGSGKTTQLPKICLQQQLARFGQIAVTQPRRLAAKGVAHRLSEECQTELGQGIGLHTRFDDKHAAHNAVCIMTDGILLNKLQHDRLLLQYQTIIIDEAHERSLNIDFLLGILKKIIQKRPELKLIIASATIDADKFCRFFNNAPLVEVSGRTYPVEILYRPLESYGLSQANLAQHCMAAVDECTKHGTGDILIFTAGERDIREIEKYLNKQQLRNTEVLPLFSRLTQAQQNRIFKPEGNQRRIIIATNVAETSITVPGIRYVIDTGKARISRYNYRTKIQSLPIENISKASCKQRAGRCGRVANGTCIRLFSAEDFELRDDFTQAEILRTNLAAVILQLKSLKLGEIDAFDFIDRPQAQYINDGFRLLQALGALDESQQITGLGKKIANLPVDPVLGRILLAGIELGCVQETMIIAAFFSVQDPRERPQDKLEQARTAHMQFADKQSDFIAIINLWRWFLDIKKEHTNSQWQRLCREKYLSVFNLVQWRDVYRQLNKAMLESKVNVNQQEADYANLHRALLTGWMLNVAQLDQKGIYQGVRESSLALFPGNMISKKPKLIVCATLLHTHKTYAVHAAHIELSWIEKSARHLLKRQYNNPYFDVERQSVLATEKVSFYQLVLSNNRKVYYGNYNAPLARQLFIEQALIGEQLNSLSEFYEHNLRVLEQAREQERRTRRRDLLVSEQRMFEWYDQRLPKNIFCLASLEKWLHKLPDAHSLLQWQLPDILTELNALDKHLYPDQLQAAKATLAYLFDPTDKRDGVTATVTLTELFDLPDYFADWLVPGLLSEKVTALLRALPKNIRKQLAPINDTVVLCLEALQVNKNIPLTRALAETLFKLKAINIKAGDWRTDSLEQHLYMTIVVVEKNEEVLAQGNDLLQLKRDCQKYRQAVVAQIDTSSVSQGVIKNSDALDLPVSIEEQRDGVQITLYPALIDVGEYAEVKCFATSVEANSVHIRGLARLILCSLAKELRYLQKNITDLNTIALLYHSTDNKQQLVDDLLMMAVCSLIESPEQIRQAQQFTALLDSLRPKMIARVQAIASTFHKALVAHHELSLHKPPEFIKELVSDIIYPGCLNRLPYRWLRRIPLYLQAYKSALQQDFDKVKAHCQQLQYWIKKYRAKKNDLDELQRPYTNEFIDFHWLIHEFAISLFAQQLKTIQPISQKRLEKIWAKLF